MIINNINKKIIKLFKYWDYHDDGLFEINYTINPRNWKREHLECLVDWQNS